MARCRQETDDEITEAEDTADAATFCGSSLRGTRQVTQPSMPDDLHTALAMPTTFGPKLFEISTLHAVFAACKVKVKDTGDLLLLRDWLMILLLLFLQKQSLAFAVYLFGIGTLHTGPGLKKKTHVIMLSP
jgi:hypothetical protein